MLTLLLLLLLPLLLLPLLPELLMLPLSLRLLPGWFFWVSSPRGCLACLRAKLSWSRGSSRGWSKPVGPANLSTVRCWLATRGSYSGAPAAAVYLFPFRVRARPRPSPGPPLPIRPLPVLVRLLPLLAMAMYVAMAMMGRPLGPTRICLALAAVPAAALVTSPVVGLSSSVLVVAGWPPCAVASPLVVVVRFLPLPPAAVETPALALSPVGVWVPVRLRGSSPPAAGVI